MRVRVSPATFASYRILWTNLKLPLHRGFYRPCIAWMLRVAPIVRWKRSRLIGQLDYIDLHTL